MLVFRLHKVSPFLSSVLIVNSTILTSIIQVSRVQEGREDVAGPQKPFHQPTHQPPSRPNNCNTIFNLPQNLKSCTTKQPTGTQYIATEKKAFHIKMMKYMSVASLNLALSIIHIFVEAGFVFSLLCSPIYSHIRMWEKIYWLSFSKSITKQINCWCDQEQRNSA